MELKDLIGKHQLSGVDYADGNYENDVARRWPGSRSLFFSRDCIESIEAVLEEERFE